MQKLSQTFLWMFPWGQASIIGKQIHEIWEIREVRGLGKYVGNKINDKRFGGGGLELSFI